MKLPNKDGSNGPQNQVVLWNNYLLRLAFFLIQIQKIFECVYKHYEKHRFGFVEFNAWMCPTKSSGYDRRRNGLFCDKCVPAFGIHNTFQENHILASLVVYAKEGIFAPHFSTLVCLHWSKTFLHSKRLDTLSQWRKASLFRVRNFMSAKLIIPRL